MILSNSCCYSCQANLCFKNTNEDAHGHKNINFKSILAKGFSSMKNCKQQLVFKKIDELFIIENKYTMNLRSIEFNFYVVLVIYFSWKCFKY